MKATAKFTVERKDLGPIEGFTGAQLGRNRFAKVFTGDLEGTGVVEAIMGGLEGGVMVYVAIERIEGTLHGRAGSFVLTHAATFANGVQAGEWKIVPGSGTGALADMHGRGDILPDHVLVLDYELAGAP